MTSPMRTKDSRRFKGASGHILAIINIVKASDGPRKMLVARTVRISASNAAIVNIPTLGLVAGQSGKKRDMASNQ